jgi:hypothetical protein
MDTNTFEEDKRINPNQLDIEWLEQTVIFFKYAEEAENEGEVLRQLEEKLNYTRAKLENDIRTDPGAYGIEKATVDAVRGAVDIEIYEHSTEWGRKHKEVHVEVMEKRHEIALIKVAVKAIDVHKKAGLENLVKLHGNKYFASPKEPRDLGMEYTAHAKSERFKDKVANRPKAAARRNKFE